jgi:hypothetical protein
LSSVQPVAPEPSRFIRNALDASDIPGSQPQPRRHLSIQPRNPLLTSDIEGCQPKSKVGNPRERSNYNPYDYRDVTHSKFESSRHTNPLAPSYPHKDEDGKSTLIGPIEGNVPSVLPPPRKEMQHVGNSLKTKDILGCGVGSKWMGNFHSRERRAFLLTNQTADIQGAHPGSLQRCPKTKRSLNPLDPQYVLPGSSELIDPSNAFSKQKSNLQQAAKASLGIDERSKLYQASRKGSDSAAN